ncbi:MAG: serine hydrolase [Cellvibrionales bacterium]|nr:serine hydrolase [Cellvibrionales bacterium]
MIARSLFKTVNKRLFHSVDIADVENVLQIDTEKEGIDSYSTTAQAAFQAVWASVLALYQTGMYPAIGFCLRQSGRIVFHRTLGCRETSDAPQTSQLMTINTPLCYFSASKAVTAILLHKLAEQGAINLLHPVAKYIPEFGAYNKEKISIYQMLSHCGGFPVVENSPGVNGLVDREKALDAIYATPSQSPNGRVQAYHPVTTGFIADELIRRVLGISINAYVDDVIRSPMEMTYFRYGLDNQYHTQAAKNYVTGSRPPKLLGRFLEKSFGLSIDEAVRLSNTDAFMTAVIPAGNMYGTAEEMSRFYQMLLNGGVYKGKQILSKDTIDIALRESSPVRLDRSLYLPMRFSSGFMLGSKPLGLYGMDAENAFGHLGFSNILCWADPDRDLSVALLTTGKPLMGSHVLALPRFIHRVASLPKNAELKHS